MSVQESVEVASVVTSWDAPTWAEDSEYDEAAVIHSRQVSVMEDLEGAELGVVLFQRDELHVPGKEFTLETAGAGLAAATVTRTAPHVIIGRSIRVSAEQAQELGQALLTAARVARS
jgi:hypothetical protein